MVLGLPPLAKTTHCNFLVHLQCYWNFYAFSQYEHGLYVIINNICLPYMTNDVSKMEVFFISTSFARVFQEKFSNFSFVKF